MLNYWRCKKGECVQHWFTRTRTAPMTGRLDVEPHLNSCSALNEDSPDVLLDEW